MSLLAALALLQTAPAAGPEPWYAVGAAPLWRAIVANDWISFETPGSPMVYLQSPSRQETAEGMVWRSGELTISVTHGDCTDALTRRIYADRVVVESGGRRYEGCGGSPRGWTRPEPYGAAGGEPFWALEIGDGRLYFGVNEDVFIVPTPRPRIAGNGRTRRYTSPGITVLIRRENCQLEDERTYADAVTVRAGHWTVEGCGGRVVREAPEE